MVGRPVHHFGYELCAYLGVIEKEFLPNLPCADVAIA